MKQKTIAKEFSTMGVGLHSGAYINMTVKPAAINNGIVFRRIDLNPIIDIKVSPFNIKNSKMCTIVIKDNNENLSVSTIEHLMSALAMFQIDNLLIEVDAQELPIMDGSSYEFVKLIKDAGIIEQNYIKSGIKILDLIRVEDKDKFAEVSPSNILKYEFTIKWNHPVILKTNNHIVFEYNLNDYISMISKARTFGFFSQFSYLYKKNLAKGASLKNTIVITDKGVLNKEFNLRYHDEFVRHKLLDAIGDFYLGGYILGHFNCFKSGHALNNKLLQTIFNNNNKWRYI